ncbi:MAG TPA: helix-turn-helix domain-containing protein [Rhodoferax sp.]
MQQKTTPTGQSDIGKTLGRVIAVRRKALALSQDNLAGLIDVDAETIFRFERGTVLPSLQRLWCVAEALQTGLGDRLSQASQLPNDQAQKLVATMRELSGPDQQLLLDFANLLRNR